MAKSKRESEAAYLARKLEQKARAEELARQRLRTRILIAGLVVLGVIAGAVFLPRLTRDTPEATTAPIALPVVTTEEADCTEDEVVTPGANWTTHVDGSHEYDAAPPSGGPHSRRTLPTGKDHFYARDEKPAPERAVHDLEHGLVVGWYDPALPDAEVAALEQVAAAAAAKKLRFVAVPWDRGEFVDGRHFVLTAWGVTRRCSRVSPGVVEAFVKTHGDGPGLPERKLPV